jgi:hypothetical protein
VVVVASPHRSRQVLEQAEDLRDHLIVRRDQDRAGDGGAEVRDVTAQPAPYLVAEEPAAAEETAADRACTDHPSLVRRPTRWFGRHLHDPDPVAGVSRERGVEEGLRRSPVDGCIEPFVDRSTHAHDTRPDGGAGTEGDPVQVEPTARPELVRSLDVGHRASCGEAGANPHFDRRCRRIR